MHVPSSLMMASLMSQVALGEIKNRVKVISRRKLTDRKEGMYKKQANDRWVYLVGERLVYDLETNSIRRRL